MADLASTLDRTLRAAGIPIIGVSIGQKDDRQTWVVQFDPSATAAQRTQGLSIAATFDPTAPSVVAADLDLDAQVAASAQIVKAICALMVDVKLNRALTPADIPTVQALFTKAQTYYKFIVTNGL